MGTIIGGLVGLHNAIFRGIEAALSNWLLGLTARVVFAATLMQFFWNSALTKVTPRGDDVSFLDYFTVEPNAFAQIAPLAYEEVFFNANDLGLEYWIMAYAGTYAEFALPLLVLIGLFTRLSSLGMLGFIGMMTWVDVTGHFRPFSLEVWFDGIPAHQTARLPELERAADLAVMDERLMWLFPLIYLALRGPGWISLDFLFGRMFRRDR